MLDKIKNKGVFVLNTSKTPDEVLASMSVHDKKILQDRSIKMFIINASKIAEEAGIPGKISAIMEALIFKLGKIIDFSFALEKIKENIATKFSNKGGDLVVKNIKAIDASLDSLVPVKIPYVDYVEEFSKKKSFFEMIDSMELQDSMHIAETTSHKLAVRVQNYCKANGIECRVIAIIGDYENFIIQYSGNVIDVKELVKISRKLKYRDEREKNIYDEEVRYKDMEITKL